jgi:hypothetical protein
MIKQGDELSIPARIKSTSEFSNGVVNMTMGTNYNIEMGSGFNFSELHLAIQRVQPPLFKITFP